MNIFSSQYMQIYYFRFIVFHLPICSIYCIPYLQIFRLISMFTIANQTAYNIWINRSTRILISVFVVVCVCLCVILAQLYERQGVKLDNVAFVCQNLGYLPCDNASSICEHMNLINCQLSLVQKNLDAYMSYEIIYKKRRERQITHLKYFTS